MHQTKILKQMLGMMVILLMLVGCGSIGEAPEISTLAKPEEMVIEDTYDIDCNGFTARVDYVQTGRVLVDNLVQLKFTFQYNGTITNLDTGTTVRDKGRGTVTWDYVAETLTVHGMIYSITVPGRGVVVLDAGKLVLDVNDFSTIFKAGPRVFLTPEEDALRCEAVS